MEVIYYCYGGSHTSVTAAALHLGLLDPERIPSMPDIISLPNFDQTTTQQLGQILRIGTDSRGNKIYVAALGPGREVTLSALKLLLTECGIAFEDVRIINALTCVNLAVRIGGFLSRRLGLVRLGRVMCARGIIRRFECFKLLVQQVKSDLKDYS